eukprot:g11467.t1
MASSQPVQQFVYASGHVPPAVQHAPPPGAQGHYSPSSTTASFTQQNPPPSKTLRISLVEDQEFPAEGIERWEIHLKRVRDELPLATFKAPSGKLVPEDGWKWTCPSGIGLDVTTDSVKIELVPVYRYSDPRFSSAHHSVGYHLVVPLIAAALDRFPTWSGTSAVYPRLQYPNVEQFFYFQNAVSLGQKVRKNTTPNVRIELALVDAMVPPEVPPSAAADPCGLGALQHGGDPFLWRGTGPAPPMSGVTPQCHASALLGVSQSGATPKNAVVVTAQTAGATAGAPAAAASATRIDRR